MCYTTGKHELSSLGERITLIFLHHHSPYRSHLLRHLLSARSVRHWAGALYVLSPLMLTQLYEVGSLTLVY